MRMRSQSNEKSDRPLKQASIDPYLEHRQKYIDKNGKRACGALYLASGWIRTRSRYARMINLISASVSPASWAGAAQSTRFVRPFMRNVSSYSPEKRNL